MMTTNKILRELRYRAARMRFLARTLPVKLETARHLRKIARDYDQEILLVKAARQQQYVN